ncbi:MAG: two-component sensor histidine kinase [Prevotellaceae bacterium]|jgi:signal transduction histidine kinase|nr:two-component sensor histidine kinase [Prevotellaceae bacterium]
MKLNYKQRLFLYIVIVFTTFTICLMFFEESRERAFRISVLVEKLDAYSEVVDSVLTIANHREQALEQALTFLPDNIRLSLIDEKGRVLFDNSIGDLSEMENHSARTEIKQALSKGRGTDIRHSASTNRKYLYYAKKNGNRYIRVALPYDIRIQRLLKSDNLFLGFMIGLFVVVLSLIYAITSRFGKSVKQLRDFALLSTNDNLPEFTFPNDELGEIGRKIASNYLQMNRNKKIISIEREKLLQHVHTSEEGICFFNAERKVEFYNSLFIQFLNTLTEVANSDPSVIFRDSVFDEAKQFLTQKEEHYFDVQLNKQGKTFSLRINVFEDESFELVLNDITRQEKTRLIKQEITGNIAHELRTPVTSIRGYLETVLEQPLNDEQKAYFITQAFDQTIVLSELIQDMSLITKMEEAPQTFKLEEVNIVQLLKALKDDLSLPLKEKGIDFRWNIDDKLTIKGNKNLLYSIFRNLTDNTIRYAGENINVRIDGYNQDKDFYYFSFYDTGTGIPNEHHLNRLFERFYRVNEGRTRDTGGSGLGLSIVKNAVTFHKGTIVAKNRTEGGLEFLFRLKK